ncbi:hypothetical protein HCU40_02125 [Pseudanabaena biceps]|nr:hypothetical protein [Pseudanabaena biceps]
MKITSFASSLFCCSALYFGITQGSEAISLTSANTLYSFGNETFGNGAGQCANNVITCTGTFNSSASFTGVTFNPFSAQGVGTFQTDYGFERGYAPSAEPDSLGLNVKGPGSGGSVNGFTNAVSRVATKYFSFSATIAPLYQLSVSAFNFSVSASGTKADFSSIVGGVETFLATNQATNGTYQTPVSYPLTTSGFYNNGSGSSPLNVEYRIYVYSVNNAAGYGIDSVSFNGSITKVPFDFSPNFGVSILGGLYATHRLRKKIKTSKK